MVRMALAIMLLMPLAGSLSPVVLAAERSEVAFFFGEGVPAEDQALIREGIRFAQEYAAEQIGRATEHAFDVDVRPSQERPVSGYVLGDTIYFSTDNWVWRESPPMRRLKIVLHEYFHLIQYETVRDARPMPLWLLEGSAELFAFQAVSSLGLVEWNAVVDHWIISMFNDPAIAGVPLEAMAHPEPAIACCLYTVSPLAVNELLKPAGWPSLLTYFDVFSGMPPDDAFAETFGQSLNDYYAAFARAQQQMFTAGYDLTALRLPWYPVAGVADVWSVTAWSPVERGGQGFLQGWTVPGVACTLTFTSASGNLLLTEGTHANPDGSVFWLWSVRTRLSEGAARADVTCGTNVVSTSIDLI